MTSPWSGPFREGARQATTGRGRPPNQLPEPTTETTTSSSASAVLKAFGAFWLTYPKRRDKEAAKKAFIAAVDRGADPAHIVEAAKTYAHERKDEDPKYTKYPATWLNKGCYDDEPDPEPGRHLRAVGDSGPHRNPEDPADYLQDWN
ncbi:hypothetical protein [Streptomyces lasiicapitis]|uniref:hypothetical protein n=1 Tax=Streptomyces lasiicapitis TaxID=1923961 RepID=UPI00367D3AA1